ncbi:hypothetical protein ACFXPQ_07395 [Streptomyces lydicus]|uniref:hypothetical protein n=1 Tax=Streptomyces lydicus TaxID=47763 RepID=UPI0036AD0063
MRLEIDQWPRVPAYLEIKGDDDQQVWNAAELLGIDREQLTGKYELPGRWDC